MSMLTSEPNALRINMFIGRATWFWRENGAIKAPTSKAPPTKKPV